MKASRVRAYGVRPCLIAVSRSPRPGPPDVGALLAERKVFPLVLKGLFRPLLHSRQRLHFVVRLQKPLAKPEHHGSGESEEGIGGGRNC